MDKSALEWATKKRSINDFQRFLEDNRNMVPDSVSQKMERLHDDKDETMIVDIGDKESKDEDGQRIEEYNALMNEVRIILAMSNCQLQKNQTWVQKSLL